MKTHLSKLLWVALGAVATALLVAASNSTATGGGQQLPNRWSHVQTVTYGKAIGFFDSTDGRFYLYDANMERCLAVRQLVELGESMRKVKN